MSIQEKYEAYRKIAKDGDILLFRGRSFLARSIQYFDDAYYNHSAFVYWNRGRLELLDAWYGGVEKVPASKRVKDYSPNGDFCVIRIKKPGADIEAGISYVNNRWHAETKYHVAMLFRIALIKKTKIDLTGLSKRDRTICSFTTRDFTNAAGVECYKNIHLITPHDFIRYADGDEVKILFHTKE